MSTTTVRLVARTATPYGTADVRARPDLIELWFGVNDARMGFIADLSPACARELAAALYAHADAAETMPKGGAA
jgi:hypothetical protein